MIARLEGILAFQDGETCIVDVNGVGYLVTVPLSVRLTLPEVGQPVSLYIYHHVWQDGAALFGFRTWEERRLFQMLLSVGGVGPKAAVAVLSGLSAQDLVLSIAGAEARALTGIPGIGRKTAERIVLELREKMLRLLEGTDWALAAEAATGSVSARKGRAARRGARLGASVSAGTAGGDDRVSGGMVTNETVGDKTVASDGAGVSAARGPGAVPDAVAALVALGYGVNEAAAAVNRLGPARFTLSADAIIRAVLRGEAKEDARKRN